MSIRIDVTPPRIVLENDILELFFVAEKGLELGVLRDKTTKQKLGEIEFSERKTAFFSKLTDEMGNEFLRAYEYEEENRLLWQVDFHLPQNSQVLYAVVTLINDTDEVIEGNWPSCYRVAGEGIRFSSREGNLWQAVLTESGMGFFSRTTRDSEVETMMLEPGGMCSFAICYGKLELDKEDLMHACVKTAINYTIADKELAQKLEHYRKYVSVPCEKILYTGSGWGAFEQVRRMKENLPLFPQQFLFPAETIGEAQQEKLMRML